MSNPFNKELKDLKLIFLDVESSFTGIEMMKKADWEFNDPILRLLTWQTYNGTELSEVKTLDAKHHQGDVWAEIKDLVLNKGFAMVGHNISFDIQPAFTGDWVLEAVFKGRVIDTMINESCLRGFNPSCPAFDIRKVINNSIEDANNEDILAEEGEEDRSYRFSLKDVAHLYLGIELDKEFQNPDYYSFLKEVHPDALKYAEEDVKILFPIFKRQLGLIQEKGMQEGVFIKTKLLATAWLYKKYGVPINTSKLNAYRKEYSQRASEDEAELHKHFPKILPSSGDLVSIFFSLGSTNSPQHPLSAIQKAGKGAYIISNYLHKYDTTVGDMKKELMEFLKSKGAVHSDIGEAFKIWVQNNRAFLERKCNLNYFGDLKQSLHRLGIETESTDKKALAKIANEHDNKEIIRLLEYKKSIALLDKVLNRFTREFYLRSDNTIKPSLRICASINGRVGISSPNMLAVPRALKNMVGQPAGMIAMNYDLSAVELQFILDKYNPPLASKSLEMEDPHCYSASVIFGHNYDKLLADYKAGDKEAKRIRNLTKTAVYFSLYKTNLDPKARFVSGSNRFIETVRVQMGTEISKEESDRSIREVETFFSTWTNIKSKVDKYIKNQYDRGIEQMDIPLPGGLRSSFLTKSCYDPEKDYVNGRSIYSTMVAGNITIGTQVALNEIQEYLVTNYGAENARLQHYVHDAFTIFLTPEIYKAEKYNILKIILENTFKVSGMNRTYLELAGISTNDKGEKLDDNGNVLEGDESEEKYRYSADGSFERIS